MPFYARCNSRTSFETASGHQRFLARPMPCSPVMAPPQAMTWREEFVQRRLGAPFGARLVEVHHDIGVDVAVAGMAEAGDGQAVFFLEPGGKLEQDPPAGRAARRCLRSVWSGRCRAGRRKIRGGFARCLRISRRPSRARQTAVSDGGRFFPDPSIRRRTDFFCPSSSTIRWARQPRRRSLLVR